MSYLSLSYPMLFRYILRFLSYLYAKLQEYTCSGMEPSYFTIFGLFVKNYLISSASVHIFSLICVTLVCEFVIRFFLYAIFISRFSWSSSSSFPISLVGYFSSSESESALYYTDLKIIFLIIPFSWNDSMNILNIFFLVSCNC